MIPDIYGQILNNPELHRYEISIFVANLLQHNIYTKTNIYNIGRNVRSVTFVETAKNSITIKNGLHSIGRSKQEGSGSEGLVVGVV